MSVEKPRIAVLGMHLESNAFAPVTTENDFANADTQGRAVPAEVEVLGLSDGNIVGESV